MSITCGRHDERLSAYRDGELGGLEGSRVCAHLRDCPNCAAAIAESEELDRELRAALGTSEPPDYLTAAIMHRLPAMPPARSRGSLVRRRWRSLRWVVGAGCAALQATALWGAFRAGYVVGQVDRGSPARSAVSATLPAPAVDAVPARERRSPDLNASERRAGRVQQGEPRRGSAPLGWQAGAAFALPPISRSARREGVLAAQAGR